MRENKESYFNLIEISGAAATVAVGLTAAYHEDSMHNCNNTQYMARVAGFGLASGVIGAALCFSYNKFKAHKNKGELYVRSNRCELSITPK